jgi:hypothetical protein
MKKLTIRLSDDMNEAVTQLARAHQRSVNKQIAWLIEQAVKGSQQPSTGLGDKRVTEKK